MIPLYANENFPQPIVERLRAAGFDVLTSRDAGNANRSVPDEAVLAYAVAAGRAVITENRKDFIALHRRRDLAAQPHRGIIVCTRNPDLDGYTTQIAAALDGRNGLDNLLVRVYRDNFKVDPSAGAPR
jgi:predicted nuclease of predicted toxin-antitoxin system